MELISHRAERLRTLDRNLGGDGPAVDLVRLRMVVQETVPVWPPPPGRTCRDPAEADDAVRSTAVVQRLAAARPALTMGPLDRRNQFWVGCARHQPLREDAFVDVADRPPAASTKPFALGLFTSTGSDHDFGMWHAAVVESADALFPPPHTVTRVDVDPRARMREVTSAAEWCAFVIEEAVVVDGLAYPDWRAVGVQADGVHLTLAAIAAVQGVVFEVDGQRIAPAYWDVESTLWLHWAFTATEPC